MAKRETLDGDPDYLMGHGESELERLQLQAEVLKPVTLRLLRDASLGTGLRVLDIGCGTGSVSALLADLVGSEGQVVGVDMSPIAIGRARSLHAGRPNLSFEVATLDDWHGLNSFDVVFGRYVLMHQADPSKFLRQAAGLLRQGGALAFHEILIADGFLASSGMPTWDRMNDYLVRALQKGLPQHGVASNMVDLFRSAGLKVPKIFAESVVGDAATSAITPWFVETIRTVLPAIVTSFGASEAEISVDTLTDRLRAEARLNNGQVFSMRQVGAWVRT